ncbi:transposase, MuDR, MULE transposase domain protein [Tanacetum coccineum]
MQKVVEDVGEDADFNSGAWVSATNYVNAFGGTVTGCLGDIDNFLKKGKLEQVVAIVKSCSPTNRSWRFKLGAAMILANVSVFTPKPSKHYLNITKRNVKRMFNDIKLAGLLADLRSSLEDSIYGDCILGVLFIVYVRDLLVMYHSDFEELICNNSDYVMC